MKNIFELLQHLTRGDVSEIAFMTGRLPCAKMGERFQPLDSEAPDADALVRMLSAVGGGRHLDMLDVRPAQWTAKLAGIGTVSAVASFRNNAMYARFTLVREHAQAKKPASLRPQRHSKPPMAPAASAHEGAHGAGGHARPKRPSDQAMLAHGAGGPARPSAQAMHAVRTKSVPPTRPKRHSIPAAARGRGARSSQPPDSGRGSRHGHGHAKRSTPAPVRDGAIQLDLEPAAVERAMSHAVPATAALLGSAHASPSHAEPAAAPAPGAPAHRSAYAEPATALGRTAAPLDNELERILSQACRERASDVHVVAGRPLLLRVGGELRKGGEALEATVVEHMVDRVVPARVRPQLDRDGSCDFSLTHPTLGRFRANAARHQGGYKLCLRIVPAAVPTLASLGLPTAIAEATRHHQGLILVTGPTGHGKTSTLAAIVDIINRDTSHHVITVEDPIEYLHPRKRALMSQREVGSHTRSFASALKASLREDPDVIVVGELRDTETVRMALSASETGHLVLGTMNTPSAAKTIDRLIDLFPPADEGQVRMTLAGGLRLIVSQRLVPTVKGGLAAAAELLPGSVPLWNLIRDAKTYQIPSLQQRGKALGIIRLDDSLSELVRSGACTLAVAKAFAEAPDFTA